MQIKGKVKRIYEVEELKNDFKKRNFVVTKDYDAEFSADIIFEVHNDKTVLLDNLSINDVVIVDFSISAKYYEPKDTYFNTVKAWKIEVVEKAQPKAPPIPETEEFNDQF